MMAARIEPDDGWNTNRLKPDHPPEKRGRKPKRERGRQRDEAHLNLIRSLPCLATGALPTASRRNDAAHIRYSSSAMGKTGPGSARPDDRWTVPLAPNVHQGDKYSQHASGEELWWSILGINPLRVAERLYDLSEALRGLGRPEAEIVQALTAVVTKARAEAGK